VLLPALSSTINLTSISVSLFIGTKGREITLELGNGLRGALTQISSTRPRPLNEYFERSGGMVCLRSRGEGLFHAACIPVERQLCPPAARPFPSGAGGHSVTFPLGTLTCPFPGLSLALLDLELPSCHLDLFGPSLQCEGSYDQARRAGGGTDATSDDALLAMLGLSLTMSTDFRAIK